jgi:hypothetical protein
MMQPYEHNPNHEPRKEPLPPGFDEPLCALDDRLARAAREAETPPPYLTDRVFAASRAHLPVPTPEPAVEIAARLRRTVGSVRAMHRQWWARTALAASVALAVAIPALVSTTPKGPETPPDRFAALIDDMEELERPPLADLGSDVVARQVAYLEQTRDLTYDDVFTDLNSMLDDSGL